MTNEMCACTCGALPVVMLLAAAVSSADLAEADLASCLVSHGIHLGTASQTVNMAREMCQDSGPGDIQADEVDQLTGAHRLSRPHAQLFVGVATPDSRPKYHHPNRTPRK
jgi:hypothetical protein